MHHAAIFATILRRNALRREARLPPLDVRAEYQEEVATAHQHEIYEQHYDVVRAEVVERLREERGPGWEGTGGALASRCPCAARVSAAVSSTEALVTKVARFRTVGMEPIFPALRSHR
jgi:uncharacterized membrane-anchored protein